MQADRSQPRSWQFGEEAEREGAVLLARHAAVSRVRGSKGSRASATCQRLSCRITVRRGSLRVRASDYLIRRRRGRGMMRHSAIAISAAMTAMSHGRTCQATSA